MNFGRVSSTKCAMMCSKLLNCAKVLLKMRSKCVHYTLLSNTAWKLKLQNLPPCRALCLLMQNVIINVSAFAAISLAHQQVHRCRYKFRHTFSRFLNCLFFIISSDVAALRLLQYKIVDPIGSTTQHTWIPRIISARKKWSLKIESCHDAKLLSLYGDATRNEKVGIITPQSFQWLGPEIGDCVQNKYFGGVFPNPPVAKLWLR